MVEEAVKRWVVQHKFVLIFFSVLFLFQRETVVSTSWKSALHGDSMWSSHPISVEVQKPEEIDDIFDAISYQKVFKDIFSCGLKSFYCEVISLKKENF